MDISNSMIHMLGVRVIDYHGLEDTASDGHVAGEGTLLIDVTALDGALGGLEAQPDALVVAQALGALAAQHALAPQEDRVLLLVGLLGL